VIDTPPESSAPNGATAPETERRTDLWTIVGLTIAGFSLVLTILALVVILRHPGNDDFVGIWTLSDPQKGYGSLEVRRAGKSFAIITYDAWGTPQATVPAQRRGDRLVFTTSEGRAAWLLLTGRDTMILRQGVVDMLAGVYRYSWSAELERTATPYAAGPPTAVPQPTTSSTPDPWSTP
jgi:hypothetical protein